MEWLVEPRHAIRVTRRWPFEGFACTKAKNSMGAGEIYRTWEMF